LKVKLYVFNINGEEVTVFTRKMMNKALRRAVQKYLRKSKVEKKIRKDKKIRLDISFTGMIERK